MTGNKNAWRAPLAGLASLAMIATMGVAASTANAAETEFVFNGNGLTFKKASASAAEKESDTYTVKSADNKLDENEIKEAEAQLNDDKSAFTDWFTTASYGTNDVVEPGKNTTTTVYAHWSEAPYTVKFAASKSNAAKTVTLASNDGAVDRVASWQVPSDSVKNDDKLTLGYYVAQDESKTQVDPTADLTSQVSQANPTVINLEPLTVDSVLITFRGGESGADLWKEGRTVELTKTDENSADYTVETEKGKPFTADVPSATFVKGGARHAASDWVTDTTKKTKFDASKAQNADETYYAATPDDTVSYKVTFKTGDESKYSKVPEAQVVESGKTVTAPADPTLKDTDEYKYEFAGWYTADGKKYDFSSKVSGELTLQAYFKVSAVKVTFDPNYTGTKKTELWISDGDVFNAPSFDRDGYVFAGWTANGFVPRENTKLSVDSEPANEPTGVITWKESNGDGVSTVKTAATSYKVIWEAVEEAAETLAQFEARVDMNTKDGESLVDAARFTEASFKQYQSDWQDYLDAKDEAAKQGYTKAEYATLIAQIKDIQSKLVEVGSAPLYREYNKNDSGHNYTTNLNEHKFLVALGWTAEESGFRVVNTSSVNVNGTTVVKNLGAPVYRVYNPNSGEHLLTSDTDEVEYLDSIGWNDEGIQFYAPQNQTTPVYRVFNPNSNNAGSHHYANYDEASALVALGWKWDNNAKPVFYFD